MRRREFILALGRAAASSTLWPLSARAQQPALPVIGFLRSTSAEVTNLMAAIRQGLNEVGVGEAIAIEFRSSGDQPDRLPGLVHELLSRKVAVIIGDAVAMRAAKAVTTTVPIVFAVGGDPVQGGLVTSLNRPGGNITGVHFFSGVLGAKRLELLSQVAPKAAKIGFLVHPATPNTEAERQDVRTAAQTLGRELIIIDAESELDIESAFAAFAQRGAGALLAGSGPFMTAQRDRLLALAARYGLPTIYHLREFVTAGGLMSYGSSITEAYRQAGFYAGRILKGEMPGDLPVLRSTKFEFALNLKTANALGLTVPPVLLATADEVIE